MEIFQAIILGIVQGLGEFLPISSTAHLIVFPYLFHWQDPGLSFDVALHMGTLVAVLLYFWRDWIRIFQISIMPRKKNGDMYNQNILWFLILASIPGAVAGYLLEDFAETAFRNPLLIAITLSVVGLLLFLVDRFSKQKKDIGNITKKDAIIIGVAQAVAIVPGVSRSGATMTAALSLGLTREAAARFSFLLSTPIIFGAAVVKVPELLQAGITTPIVAGILAAAVSGYLAIKYMLQFIQKVGYAPFFWYRLGLSILIVLVYVMR